MRHTSCALVTVVQTCALPISVALLAVIANEVTADGLRDDHSATRISLVRARIVAKGRQALARGAAKATIALLTGIATAVAASGGRRVDAGTLVPADRKCVEWGKRWSGRLDLGCRRAYK